MKTRKISLIILSLLAVLSCREEDKKFVSIVGKWKGTLAEVQIKPFGLPTPFSKRMKVLQQKLNSGRMAN